MQWQLSAAHQHDLRRVPLGGVHLQVQVGGHDGRGHAAGEQVSGPLCGVRAGERQKRLTRYGTSENNVCEGRKHTTVQLRVLGRIVDFDSAEVGLKSPVLFSFSLSQLASGLEMFFYLRFDSAHAVLSFLETALLPLQVVPKSFSFGLDEA